MHLIEPGLDFLNLKILNLSLAFRSQMTNLYIRTPKD